MHIRLRQLHSKETLDAVIALVNDAVAHEGMCKLTILPDHDQSTSKKERQTQLVPITNKRRLRRREITNSVLSLPKDRRWAYLLGHFPASTRDFVDQLASAGTLTISEALARCNWATSAKAFGGITGSIQRMCLEVEVDLPFSAGETEDGERMWTWVGE